MTTLFYHRLLILIPGPRRIGFNAWWTANVDAAGGDQTFTAALNPSGLQSDPPTHYWACAALTADQFKTIAIRLGQLAQITLPVNWNILKRNQKRDWFRQQMPAMLAATNIRLLFDDNDDDWSNYQTVLESANLKPIHDKS